MTVYFFDKDKPNSGTSVCTGACAATWPAVTTTSAKPSVKGVTGTVGTITDPEGSKQITIDGRPIYTFAGDSAAGQVNGQGVQGIWFVVSPSGTEITSKAGGSGSSGSSGY
jgi:predicted lipoprotein with Yx(FWY)xxD motif